MRHIGIDYGTKRIGLALSDEEGNIAFPHSVIAGDRRAVSVISELCAKEQVGKIVIGRPLMLSGEENPIAGDVEKFSDGLARATGLAVELEDERYTTQEALRVQGRTCATDASAAALILKSYLDRHGRA